MPSSPATFYLQFAFSWCFCSVEKRCWISAYKRGLSFQMSLALHIRNITLSSYSKKPVSHKGAKIHKGVPFVIDGSGPSKFISNISFLHDPILPVLHRTPFFLSINCSWDAHKCTPFFLSIKFSWVAHNWRRNDGFKGELLVWETQLERRSYLVCLLTNDPSCFCRRKTAKPLATKVKTVLKICHCIVTNPILWK